MTHDEPTVRTDSPLMAWGSDAVAQALQSIDLPYIALNPGASFRGLHDSVVNYLGNEGPSVLLCLHEEHAVAIAHGYAKVTGRPMAVALHCNVGLMHASMAIFNAWCDRVPMVILGATGPVDAADRRPWIDWLHTSADQGALIRDYVKWDDQPGSAQAAVESVVRAGMLTRTYPCAPTYVNLDAGMQEAALDRPVALPDPSRHQPPTAPPPSPESATQVVQLLDKAECPLILMGRVSRGQSDWDARIRLVERLGACVLSDLKAGAAFPTDHPAHPAPPGAFLTPGGTALLRAADVVLSLDWIDLGGTLAEAYGDEPVAATVISCSMDATLHNGWSQDHFSLPPVDVPVASHPDQVVDALLAAADEGEPRGRAQWPPSDLPAVEPLDGADGEIVLSDLAEALRSALGGREACLVRLPTGWRGADLHVAHPLDHLGHDGGGGLGAGPGLAVGAALALVGTERLAVAVLGDGDLLMGNSALWTAAHYRLPLLVVVANNRSFYNDEVHQERVARARDRPVENRWIGQHIRDPAPDLATMARSMGLTGVGPVTELAALDGVLDAAVSEVCAGGCVLVDVHVSTAGYSGGAASAGR